jgi:predicted DNA-binding transcriptional regulator AlpA
MKLLREQEAAQISSLSVAFFRNRRLRGDGPPYVRVGRAVRYEQAALEAWLRSKQVAHTSEPAR